MFSGVAFEGFKLRMVHILFRHGERLTYIRSGVKLTKPEDCLVDTGLFGKDETLNTFVRTMTEFAGKQQHGNYFKNWELFPNQPACPKTSLTGIGAIQHLKLGQYFRDKYLTQSTIFDKETPLTSQIYTCTSETTRTYQSAIAFLYGFLATPYFNLTNLKISPADHYFCSVKLPMEKTCGCKYGKLLDRKLSKLRNTYFTSTIKTDKHILKSVQDSGFGDILPYYALIDVFSHPACHNRFDLCSSDDSSTCWTKGHFQQLWEKFEHETRYVVEHSKNITYYYTAFYPLMAEIADRLNDHVNGRSKEKLVVYSGHDISLMALLYMLGLDGNWISYAGRIVIELYEYDSNNDTDTYYIRILYSGEDLTQNVKFCKGKTFKGLCKLSLFYDFVFNEMLQQFGYTSYIDVCSDD